MAIKSMTGFGEGSARRGGIAMTAVLSSVNRRQLDVHLQLPRELMPLEGPLTEQIRAAFHRGKIQGQVRWADGTERPAQLRVDAALACEAVSRLRALAKELKLADDLSAAVLPAIPELVRVEPAHPDLEQVKAVAEAALAKAIRALARMRAAEGRILARDLRGRLAELERLRRAIEKEAPRVVETYRERLFERLRRLGLESPEEDERILKEIALFADRCDISEELVRLRSHLVQARSLLNASEPAGRTLDFLCQELFREINTVGSKANSLEITRHVVAFKSELERFREQIQNVE